MMHSQTMNFGGLAALLFLGSIALALVTLAFFWLHVDLASTAFAYLVVILLISLMGSFTVSALLSIVSVAGLTYFFAPPIYSLWIDDPQHFVVVAAFFLTSLIVTRLIRNAREEKEAAIQAEADLRRSEADLRDSEQQWRKAQSDLTHVTRVTTLGELTASISHEVNQPLTAVVANAEACLHWLRREPPDLDAARRSVEWIINDGNRASEVIRRIRAFANKTDIEKVPLDINDVIKEVIALVQREMESHQVSLRTEIAPALPMVLADRVQLQQVIINLVINGIEAMQPVKDRPRELMIRSGQDETCRVLVSVTDCGVGISAENADRLFNAFFTTKSSGLGMGLAICRSIVEAHGGRLLASANEGPGATFQFVLPLHQEEDAS
jgi:C4-dicarboxylate-specific signal transduction histidine kinase